MLKPSSLPSFKSPLACLALSLMGSPLAADEANAQPGVLFIMVDDLRDTVSFLDNFSAIETPNLDRLQAAGTTFTNAHCAAPACAPSRTALFTGLLPSTTGVYENGQSWPEAFQEHVTLTQEMILQGYHVIGSGKTYHGQGRGRNWHAYFNVPWDTDYGEPGDPFGKPLDMTPEETPDGQRVTWAIERLQEAKGEPLFLACGIVKPHLPFNAPREYFERFPLDEIPLPEVLEGDLDDVPPLGRKIARRLKENQGRMRHDHVLEHDLWRRNIQAYLACVAFVDDQVGRLLDAWEASPYAEEGIIMLMGDHGWHLGEKEHWSKFSLWRVATRVPLVIVAPGVTEPGSVCDRPVSLVDIFPTVLALTDSPPRRDLDGNSLMPLLRNPEIAWEVGALTFHGHRNVSVHAGEWHYIHYYDQTKELYNLREDPHEFTNLAPRMETDPFIRETIHRLHGENIPRQPADPAPFYGRRQSFFAEE